MLSFMGGVVDRGLAVAGALLFVQIPLFIQHYIQQLVGRTEELKLQVSNLRQAAAFSHKTLEQYIDKFLQSADQDFMAQGQFMQSILNRWNHLSEALFSLQHCTLIEKPFLFFSFYTHEIAVSTFQYFKFGLLFTLEGGVYALIGMLTGSLLYKIGRKTVRMIKPTFR